MKTTHHLRATAAAVATLALFLLPPPHSAAALTVRPTATEPIRTVTLITGDRVTVRGENAAATVEPGPGRTDIQFLTRRVDGHLSVIPSDALSLVRSDHLDSRLFDVTTLLTFGYDDRRSDLRLIVAHTAEAREITLQDITSAGGRMMRDLPSVHGMAVEAQKASATELWNAITEADTAPRTLDDGIEKVWLDGLRQPTLDESVPQIGAPAAWAAGLDGAGATVAVLDTGIDADHPDLAGKVTAESNFTEGTEGNEDLVGHGTHVASTVAGGGAVFRGVAPGAHLLDGKVCAKSGCADSWILAGMEWAASRARVVNMSLGGPDTAEEDPLEQAVQTLSEEHGTLFAIAAGNTAPALPVNSPSTADAALSVGAVSKQDGLANFSSQGPRLSDGAIKPDLTAPGVDITAARSSDATLGDPSSLYVSLSGTSMATPHAAGAAAILAQQHPDWPGSRLKAALMTAAKSNPALTVFAQGTGRLDVAKAVTQTVTAEPASVSFGRQAWPHEDDAVLTRTVTYHNDGTSPVTLALAVDAAVYSLDKDSVTIPAGGDAEVTVTADTRTDGASGSIVGTLTASAGDAVVRTPVAVDREVESYQLTTAPVGLDGQPALDNLTVVANWDGSLVKTMPATGRIRVPRGSYTVMSVVTSARPDGSGFVFAVLAQPRLELTGDQTVTLDARLGQPVSVTLPVTGATQVFSEVGTVARMAESSVEVGSLGASFSSMTTGQIGSSSQSGFSARIAGTYAAASPAGNPDAYNLTWYTQGNMPTGFSKQVTTGELATVHADHAGQTTDTEGRKAAWSALPDALNGGFAAAQPFPLPSVRTEFYNTDGGGRWGRSLDEVVPSDQPQYVTSTVAPVIAYQAGQVSQESWNRGVFGPTVAAPQNPDLWVTRAADEMRVMSPLYGDGSGRAGYSAIATASITISRDGSEVAQADSPSGVFPVPAEAGAYRVEIVSERAAPAELSTKVAITWTFTSGHVSASERLPVSTVQFTPPVDNENTAPAGQTAAIPVKVQAQPGSPAGSLRTLAVDVSYDDGQTWATAPVTDNRAEVHHPDAAGYVSLRATATDSAGNTVTQTIIRAYRIA